MKIIRLIRTESFHPSSHCWRGAAGVDMVWQRDGSHDWRSASLCRTTEADGLRDEATSAGVSASTLPPPPLGLLLLVKEQRLMGSLATGLSVRRRPCLDVLLWRLETWAREADLKSVCFWPDDQSQYFFCFFVKLHFKLHDYFWTHMMRVWLIIIYASYDYIFMFDML